MTGRSVLSVVAAVLFACASGDGEDVGGPAGRALLVAPLDGSIEPGFADAVARVEVAATPEARERGLMGRESLGEDRGMLFVYPDEQSRWFWMKDTLIPLSIAFADARGRIVRILDMEPGVGVPSARLPRYPSDRPAMYALEMRRGWFRSKGISEGDHFRLHPALLPSPAR